jgi:hypothetical protein
MEKLSFWNRLCGIVISAGMLTSVLCFSGCKASKASSTAVRLDSTRYNVTVVSTIELVPMKVTDLVLTPDHLTRLTQLPKGYSLVAPSDEGVDLRVESNGSGDLLVVAEAPMMSLRKDSIVQDIETHIRDETQNLKTTTGVLPASDNTWAVVFLIAAILIFVEIKFKD